MSFISLTDLIYPVGAIYQSNDDTSPASLFGGTWVGLYNCFLWNAYGSEAGGSSTHTLTVNEMPSHDHAYTVRVNWSNTTRQGIAASYSASTNMTVDAGDRSFTTYTGGGQAFSIMPPYRSCHCWIRTN